jgi:hypothetical protein
MIEYNININTPTFSTSYPLTNNLTGSDSNFKILMDKLLDNDSEIITSKNLRDFFLSINDSTIFKLTENQNGKFIGFDKGNPNDPDLKNYKIIIGNRLYNNNNPIINQNVINSNTDIILSKTTNSNLNKITILTNNVNNPSLEVDINFNIKNKENINLNSEQDSIKINNLSFPSKNQNLDINNNFLILENSNLVWKKISTNIDDINIPINSTIIGNTNLNNYNLEFIDERRCPIKIGDLKIGETFDKISISDMLKKIIYDYLPPYIELSFTEPHNKNTIEVGSTVLPKVQYKIFKKTKPLNTLFVSLLPSSIPLINSNNYKTVIGLLDTVIVGNISNISYTFSAILNDGIQNIQKSIVLNGVYPYFYGFSNKNILENDFLTFLIKDLKVKSDTNIEIIGTGTYYFIYPHSYGQLSQILSNNLPTPNIYSTFFNSPNNIWNNIRFFVYEFNNINITQLETIIFKI